MEDSNIQVDGSNDAEDILALDLDTLDPDHRQKVEEELKSEIAKVWFWVNQIFPYYRKIAPLTNQHPLSQTEEEIQALRQVLAARIKHSQDLKKKLGIGVWKELQNDFQQSIKNVQETTA